MTHLEFKLTHTNILMAVQNDVVYRYGILSLCKFKYSSIARIDNSFQFLMENLTTNPDSDFTLHSKLNWSKYLNEEHDAPNQILIGVMDLLYCVLLGLAVFLESFIESGAGKLNPFVFDLSEDESVPEGGIKAKET